MEDKRTHDRNEEINILLPEEGQPEPAAAESSLYEEGELKPKPKPEPKPKSEPKPQSRPKSQPRPKPEPEPKPQPQPPKKNLFAFSDKCFDRLKVYKDKKEEIKTRIWFRLLQCLLHVILAFAAVVPLMRRIWETIPFSYEANDDSVLVQILDGSYTGSPEAHSIFVRYPLSLLIKNLYVKNPAISVLGWKPGTGNWYIIVIAGLETLALVCVLFRILNAFRCNQLLICLAFDLAFVWCWLPHFSDMTFSTAGAFMGCMSMLFLAFARKEEAWRPWNLVLFGIMLGSAFCLRKQCAYMVLPFIAVIILVKYHIHFFRSVKPWFVCTFTGALIGALFFVDGQTYGSQGWKQYLLYNHARAYLQDYADFPEYEEDEEFYRSIGMNLEQRDAAANYTYCIADGFEPGQVLKIYDHVKEKEKKQTWKEKIEAGRKRVTKYFKMQEEAGAKLTGYAKFFWILLTPLFILTLISCLLKGPGIQLLNLIEIGAAAALTYAEWIYLVINGRFPARVQEVIWLLTFCTGFLLIGQLLLSWRDNRFVRIPLILQILILAIVMRAGPFDKPLRDVRGSQLYTQSFGAEKQEILKYCGAHPDRYYVLDTLSFVQGSLPEDDLRQGNWIMSGSWTAYSPVYYEKLKTLKTDRLGPDFLLRKNVYLITKGTKNIAAKMGFLDEESVETEIVDEIITSANSFYEIYKVKKIHGKD